MADDTKKWYQSKLVWAGIVTALIGASETICLQFGINLATNQFFGVVLTILGAFGIYNRATSDGFTTPIK